MNKKIPALMALMLSLAVAGNAGAAETPDVSGDWYAGMYGIPVTLSLADETFTLNVLGESIDGTWEMTEEGILLSDEAGLLTVEGDTLTLEDGDVQVTFSREPVETFTPGTPRTDAAEEEFAGTWNSTYVNYLGMIMNGSEAGLDMTAVISGTDVTLQSESMELTDKVIPCVYNEGTLEMKLQAEEPAAAETQAAEETTEAAETAETAAEEQAGDGMAMKLSLLDDGSLAMDMEVYGLEVTFYLEKTAEPAAEETTGAQEETPAEAETSEAAEETAA